MTQAQHIASDPNISVWVGASAGTGKTKVLTDRVLRLLLGGASIDAILCLTFTNAAAQEMANRIQQELGRWSVMPQEQLEKNIAQLTGSDVDEALLHKAQTLFAHVLDAPGGLRIQTIHGFCQMLIQSFPLESGVSPNFTVMDERTSTELLDDARLHLFAKESVESELAASVERLVTTVHPSRLTELLNELFYHKDRLVSGKEHLLQRSTLLELFGVGGYSSEEEIIAQCCVHFRQYFSDQELLHIMVEQGSKTDAEKAQSLLEWLAKDQVQQVQEFAQLAAVFLTASGEPRKQVVTKSLASKNPAIATLLEQAQGAVCKAQEQRRSWCIAQQTYDLLCVAIAILERYEQQKLHKGFLDYYDLVATARGLLINRQAASWVLYKLDGGVHHILVDEAQDTSPDQWQIVEALCAEFHSGNSACEQGRSVFVVGDEKQSIYSFQGADPKMFHQMHQLFEQKTKQVQLPWETVDLNLSFRSTAPVLECVDKVFSSEFMQRALSKDHAKEIKHAAFRSSHAGLVEIWPLVENQDSPVMEPWELPLRYETMQTTAYRLAENIAKSIAAWLKEKRILASKGRAVRPGDIMILVRRRNNFVDTLVALLKQYSIPIAGVDRMVVTEHLAVMDVVALGKFLLFPDDDLTLAVLLKSPLIGLSEEQLLDVCQREPLESVWSSLRRKSQTNSDYKYAYEYLEALLNKVDFLKPFEMFSYVLDVLDGRRLLAQRLGDEVHEPLNEFLQIALNFEQTHTPSLQTFLHWLEEGKTEIKRDLDQEVNAVRILTVHGAKGLQAPIVFLPDTTQVPQARSQIFTHSHNDEDVLLWSESSSKDNALLKQLRQQEEQERYSEYMRLLYVALTRAEDELYIAGYESGKKVSDRSWYSLIKGALEKGAHVDGGVLYLTSEQEAPVKNSDNSTEVVVELFPDYLKGSPENSDDAVSRYQASSFEEDAQPHYYSDSNYGIERGKLIHSLLELLPGVEKEERYGYALKVAQSYREFFEPKQLDLMIKESISLLDNPDLSELFSTSSFAELPIFGKIDGALFSGQIDCLVMKEKELWVVDYKTQTSPPEEVDEVPRSYWYQMAIYRHLLKPLYPQHVVRCFLLWTYNAKLMELPLGDLDKIAVSKLEKHPNSTYDN